MSQTRDVKDLRAIDIVSDVLLQSGHNGLICDQTILKAIGVKDIVKKEPAKKQALKVEQPEVVAPLLLKGNS